jgi:peroxiredoxin Q/BCP
MRVTLSRLRSTLRLPSLLAVLLVGALAGCAKGELLAPGARTPDASLLDQSGRSRTLASFRGGTLLLYFYPKDGTPGCTREACAFRDVWARFEEAGIAVVGVSTDDVASHAEFAREHELPFPLLADEDAKLAEAFGVRTHVGLASRVSFLIDAEGVVRATFRDVDPGVHADEVLAEAARLGLTRAP